MPTNANCEIDIAPNFFETTDEEGWKEMDGWIDGYMDG